MVSAKVLYKRSYVASAVERPVHSPVYLRVSIKHFLLLNLGLLTAKRSLSLVQG